MNELIAYAQSIIDYLSENGGRLDTASQQALGGLLQNILQVIEQNENPAIPQPLPEIPASPFESSNVNGMKYDPKTQNLLVQFHGKYPEAEGDIYQYSGIPPFIFDLLEKGKIGPKTSGKNRFHQWVKNVTPSLGGALNALLKAGGFQYQKLS